MLGADIPASATANSELQNAADEIAKSAQEVLKKPQLENIERHANIRLKLAEAKEREANARKIALEADILEAEHERQEAHESQKIVDLMIQRGEIIFVERDDEIVFIVKKPKNK